MGEDDQGGVVRLDGLDDGSRHGRIADGHIVERPVGLDVLHADAGHPAEGIQRTELVERIGPDLVRCGVHLPPAEANEVEEAGVSADGDARRLRPGDRLLDHARIAAVEATGDVGAGDQAKEPLVLADGVGAKALAEIAVEVDAHGVGDGCHGATRG